MTDWNEVSKIAARVGKNVGRQWPGIDPEDIAHEALRKALEWPGLMQDEETGAGFIYAFLERVGTQYASQERYEYTMRSAACIYTPSEIRAVLARYWEEPDVGTEMHVTLIDIMGALEALNADDRFRIERRYKDGIEFPTDAARKACDRAVDKLAKLLNSRVNTRTEETIEMFGEVSIRYEEPRAPYAGETDCPLWDVPPARRQEFISARNRAGMGE